MDFKNILASLNTIAEGETKETEKGRVHKGEYGNKYGKEDVRDQYGHKVGKKDKGAEAKKDAPKKGRGRPKKDTGDAGEKFDTSALSSVMGGKKPKKEVGKVSKKHSLKEYMESVEDTKNAEAVFERVMEGVNHTSVANNLAKLARVIKSVQTPEQFAVAQKYAQRMSGAIQQHQHAGMGFGSGLRANIGVSRDIQSDLKAKAAELGIDYNPLEEDDDDGLDLTSGLLGGAAGYALGSGALDGVGTAIGGMLALEGGEQVSIAPAQTNTQVIKQGDRTLGTVNNPQLAATIKSAIGKGEMSLNPNEQQMNEINPHNYDSDEDYYNDLYGDDGDDEYDGDGEEDDDFDSQEEPESYYEKYVRTKGLGEGKDEGKPGKNFAKIAKSAGQKYGSKAAGERVAGAVRNKLKAQGKLEEGEKLADKDYDGDGKRETGKQEHKGAVTKAINKALGKDVKDKVKESTSMVAKLLTEGQKEQMLRFFDELATGPKGYNINAAVELKDRGLASRIIDKTLQHGDFKRMAGTYKGQLKDAALEHFGFTDYDESLEEADINPRDSSSIQAHRQHALAEPTSNFTKPGSPMAVPRGTKTEINRPVPNPTPWGTDPIAAATDRAFNFIDSLGKGTKFTKEGTDMKDTQLESWSKQLNGLLNEGITVSSSQGQQGSPDSVSVTATDGDAESLLSVLRNAGIGGFGAEKSAPEIGYGVAQGGEEEPTGTGTEPQASPDVVGDGDDMMALIKKMAGLGGDDAEVVAVSSDEEGQDYEDEEGSDDTTLQPADGDEEETSGDVDSDEEGAEEGGEEDEGDDEEQTDEGNAFTGKLKQTPQGGNFKMGGKSYKDTSSIEEGEHECNECGMLESECGCDHEQVEENFSNSANDPAEAEFAKLKALLAMGGDLHKMKRDQTVGNPTQVSVAEAINDWKKLSGIK